LPIVVTVTCFGNNQVFVCALHVRTVSTTVLVVRHVLYVSMSYIFYYLSVLVGLCRVFSRWLNGVVSHGTMQYHMVPCGTMQYCTVLYCTV
jgi:hypothetical protein